MSLEIVNHVVCLAQTYFLERMITRARERERESKQKRTWGYFFPFPLRHRRRVLLQKIFVNIFLT